MRTLKSTPIVAVEDSESNWSSQYRMSTGKLVSKRHYQVPATLCHTCGFSGSRGADH